MLAAFLAKAKALGILFVTKEFALDIEGLICPFSSFKPSANILASISLFLFTIAAVSSVKPSSSTIISFWKPTGVDFCITAFGALSTASVSVPSAPKSISLSIALLS